MATKRNVYNENKANSVFAIKIRNLFEESGNTHGKLAEYIEKKTGESVTRQAVGQWCNGNSCPNLKIVPVIADFFGVSTDYLLTNTGIKSSKIEITGVCEYTGLSEKAVRNIQNAYHKPITEGENILFEGIDSILSGTLILSLALSCMYLQKKSAELISSLPLSFEAIVIASQKLNVDSEILIDYIYSMISSYTEQKNIKEKEKECDLLRYNISKISEHICNYYDLRSTYEYLGKSEWMKVLSLTDEKILELQEKGNHRQKEGD